MYVFLKDGHTVENLGPREGVASLFDTIACRLEPAGRGTRFPMISTRLRLGRVTPFQAVQALQELGVIAPELQKLPASRVLWAAQSSTKKVKEERQNSPASATGRLIAPDGRPLLDHLLAAAQRTANTGRVLQLRCPAQDRRELLGGLGVSIAGIAWSIVAHALFPRWVIAPSSQSASDPSGIPLWTFGVLAPALAVPAVLGAMVPAVKVWSAMHVWGLATWYSAVAILWLVFALMQ